MYRARRTGLHGSQEVARDDPRKGPCFRLRVTAKSAELQPFAGSPVLRFRKLRERRQSLQAGQTTDMQSRGFKGRRKFPLIAFKQHVHRCHLSQ